MKIALLGDMAFYGKYSLENDQVYNYFADVSKELSKFDYVVGNLETPFSNSNKTYGNKSAFIKAKDENVKLLKYLNINIVNLANNHIFDYGKAGYENTKKLLTEHSVDYFGIDDKQIKIDEADGKVALSGYCCYSTNGHGYYNQKSQKGVNILNAFEVENNLISNHKEGFLNIASIHAGQEHVNYPNYTHVEMARTIAEKVPYVFYGHHPHVIQGIEQIEDSLIAYSLGNFCFDDVYTKKSKKPLITQSVENKKSFILSLEIKGNKLINYEVIPLYAGEKQLKVGVEQIFDEINNYSQFIKINGEKYIEKRNKLLNEIMYRTKSNRNFKWYVKRLNIKTLGRILNSKLNQKNFKKNVKDYVIRKN